MASAYQSRPYDSSAHTARMGDLLRARGEVAAREASVRGQAWAGAAQDIGQTISGTMGQLVAYQQAEPRRRREEAQMAKAEREERRQGNLEGVMQMAGQLPPEDAIDLLRKEGYTQEAGQMQAQLSQARRDGIADQKAKLELASTQLNKALDLLSAVDGAPEPDRPTAYSSVAPQVRELVGEDLGKMVPDAYDPRFMANAMEWGMSAKDKLSARREAITNLRLDHKDKRDADEHFTETLSKWLGTVDDQQEWTDALQNARDLGAPAETLAKFGDAYSPEAVAKAVSFTAKERPPAAAGSLEDYVNVKTQENGGKPLTPAQIRQARAEYTAAGRDPSGKDDAGRTMAQLQAARDRRYDRMREVEKGIEGGTIQPADAEAMQHRIDSEYALATGQQPPPPLRQAPTDLVASEGRTSYEAPREAPRNAGGTMGDLLRPQPSHAPSSPFGAQPASAAPAPASQVPPEVAEVLQGLPPGRHTLSDGSVWQITGDGKVARVK